MPREAFDTWLRHARLVAHEDGTYVIGVQNIYAREWLEHRLKKVIIRTLSQVAQRGIEVRFVVVPDRTSEATLHEAGPLLADLESEGEEVPRFERLSPGETGLNPRHTFETYAVGINNRLAYAAALAVVEAPAAQFNPLYVYGGVGLGKSHLLHAIGNACAQHSYRVLFASAETFTNDLVGAIRTHNTDEFRDKYRNLDVLLVDDVQFLAGKESTQEEFYHTFDVLYNTAAQIVLASNKPPSGIRHLDPRLRSRFEGGLVIELQPPDLATRMDILRIKAALRGFDSRLSTDVMERIAGEYDANVRELEGALNRVVATVLLTHEVPSLETIERVLGQAPDKPELTLENIIMAVAEYYSVAPADLTGRERSREVSAARQVAMYLAHHEAHISLQEIGEALGGRNHSTVLYSCERIADLMETDSPIRRQVRAILQSLMPQETRERCTRYD